MRDRRAWWLLAALLMGIARAVPATPSALLAVPVVSAAEQVFRLDGRLSEDGWARAALLESFYEVDPGDRLPARVRTEVRLVQVGNRLWVGIRAFDPDPTQIHDAVTRRDDGGDDVDKVTVYLDGMGLRRYAQFFEISAAGSTGDGLFSETSGSADQVDAQFGVEDRSPNYRFSSAVARLPDGWSAELAIPLSSLRYEAGSERPWTVLAARNYPREQAYYFLSAPVPHEATCLLCHATALAGISTPAEDASVQGAVTLSSRREVHDDGTAPAREERHHSAGVDLKLRLRADTHADLTWRPDFSQVEIDAPQLAGNSRLALYFPEKRPFFLEGADILESPLPVLRTRSLAAPDVGLRVTRRDAAFDGTLMVVRDGATGDMLLPAAARTDTRAREERSTATLARGRLHLGRVTLGAVYSERRYEGGLGHNRVVGVDGAWQPSTLDRIDLQFLSSDTTALQAERGVARAGSAWQMRWFHRRPSLNVDGSVRRVGAGFRADNGFIERAAVQQSSLNITGYRRQIGSLPEAGVYAGGQHDRALVDDSTLLQKRYVGSYMMLPRLTRIWWEPVVQVAQRVDVGARLRDSSHWLVGVSSVPSAWWSGLSLEVRQGSMLDVTGDRIGRGRSIEGWVKLQPHARLQVQADHKRQSIAGGAGAVWFREDATRWLVLWHLAPDVYLRGIDQRRRLLREAAWMEHEVAQTVSLQARMQTRWLLDAGLTRRRQVDLVAWRPQQAREVFLKGTYEFE